MNALLRRLVRGAASPRAAMPVRRMQLEEMEARVLHSADLAPGALGDASTSQVELRRIDPAPASPAVAQAAEVTRHELVIVDTATPDYQRLLDDIAAQGELHRTLDVLLIDRDSNGVQQITEALAGLHDLDAIHIISHGADGAVRLGSQTLDTGSLAQYAAEISQWGDALTAQADVLIYGCDVAQTETGRALLRELSALSGADVAGSIDLTGNAAFGGDWDLEFAIGSIESRIAVSADAQASWQGTLANSAPVITGANNLTPVNEDATNGGTRVADLVAGGVVTDADVAALSGIAVTAVDNTNGAWQYSTNGGAAWNSFGAPGAGNARLLAADANTYVRFVPNANWNGTVTNGLTFRAWDQTTGSNGGVAWTIPNPVLRDEFGTAFYTNDDGTARWSAGWVDSDGSPGGGVIRLNAGELDIRSNNSGSIYREADLSGATSATLSFTYTNSFVAGDTALINLQVSNNGGASYTTLTTFSDAANTGVGTFSTDISAYISASTRIQFVIASTSSPTRTLAIDDVQIACVAVGNGSSSAFSAATASSSISVNAVNDAPTGANNTVTAIEDTPFVFTRTQFGYTDAGDAPVNSLLGVYITTMPAAGSLTLDNMAVTAGQLVSAADIDAGKLVFTGAANANATNYASFTFQVQDDGGTALGGVDVDTVARTMTIDVTAVNDAPVGTNTTVATNEDTPFVFSAASFGFTDPNDTPANSLAAVKIAALPVAGTLTLDGTAVSAGQLITAADIAAGKLIFTAAPNASGAAYASFTFQVQDDGGVANGGIDLDAVARTMTIDVTAVNDAPVGTSTTVTTNEDTPVVFTAASFGFTDPGDTPANTLAAVKITTLPVAGALALNGIAVTAGQLVTAADIILGALVFTPAANANGAGYASFTFQVQDNGGGTTNIDAVARTMTIDVTAVNDAPVNTMPAAQSTTSNSPVTFGTGSGNAIVVGDADAGGAVLDVTLSAMNGVLTLGTTSGLTISAGTGSTDASMTFRGTVADINAALNGLRFDPTLAFSGAAQVDITTNDLGNTGSGGAHSTTNSVAINVSFVNTAPTLAGAVNLTTMAEDPASNSGALVSALIAGKVTDPNASPLGGIAVTAVDNTNGTWQYSLNGGSSWTAFGAASASAARLLAADANSYVRFVPNANWHGTVTNGITFRAWDQTDGTAGGTADTSAVSFAVQDNFGAVSYANQDGTANWSANWVDSDGGGASSGQIAVSGGSLQLDGALLSSTNSIYRQANLAGATSATLSFDYNNGVSGTTITVEVSGNGGANYTQLTNSFASGSGSSSFDISAYAAANTRIRVTISSGLLGLGTFTLDNVRIAYVQPLNGGASAFSAATASSSVTVTSVNDAPAGANNTVTAFEDTAFTFTAAHFGYTDSADTPANAFSAVRITTLPGAGTLTSNGVAVTAGQFVSVADINLGRLVYTPGTNANGAAYASFTFQVQDDGGTGGGGIDLDTVARTMTIDVTAINDAPVGTSKTVTTNEDTPYVFGVAAFGLTDPSDTPDNSLLAVKITTLPGAGALTLGGVAVTTGQYIGVADLIAGNLVFTAAANANGAGYASFTFQVQDDGGGADLDTVARTMTVDVTSINDAPVGTSNTLVTSEDTPLVFTAAAFGYSDPGDNGANSFAGVRISSLPVAGGLRLDGTAVSAGQFVSVTDLAAGKLVFTPAANANGAGYASFTFRVRDDGGTANGGTNLDTVARTMTVDVTAVSDAPTGTSRTVITNEDTPLVFNVAAFGFADAADGGANNLIAVKISTLPPAGALTLNGVAVTAGQYVGAADIAAGRLAFIPAAEANGTGYASFTFQVQDDGGVAGGGADLDPVARTMTIDVTAVNDAPVGTSATVSTNEDTALVLNAAAFGFTDPVDGGAHTLSAVRITTLPLNGALTLNGAAVTAGQFVSAADIAAGKLVYAPAANANGAAYASFTFQVQDSGGVLIGGVDLDAIARTLTIDVAAVNDAPAGAPITVGTNEDTGYAFRAADFGFTDPTDGGAHTLFAVQISSLPASGALMLNGSAVAAGQFVSIVDIAGGKLVYTPAQNANGAGIASFTFRVQDDGGTLDGGVDLDAIARTLTFDVASVNDAPVGTSRTVTGAEDAPLVLDASAFGYTDPNDTAASTLLAVRIDVLPQSGLLALDGVAVTAGQVISAADVHAGRLVFTAVDNANGTAYASLGFRVQDDGGGDDTDALTRTLTIDVAAVNDAPTGTDNAVVTRQDAPFVFNSASFGFSDAGDTPTNRMLGVRITTAPGAGGLRLNGAPIGAGQYVSVEDIDAGRLVYAPAAGASGVRYGSFTFQVRDDGGTAIGGVDTDTLARTMTIDVTPAPQFVAEPVVVATFAPVREEVRSSAPPAPAPAAATSSAAASSSTTAPAAATVAAAPAGDKTDAGDKPAGEAGAAGAEGKSAAGFVDGVGATGGAPAVAVSFQSGVQRLDSQQAARDMRNAVLFAVSDAPAIVALQSDTTQLAMSLAGPQTQAATSAAAATAAAAVHRELASEMDEIRDSLREQATLEASTVAVSAAASLGFSVGYVVWLLRGGVLLSTVLYSLPAWRSLDPLPVLERMDGEDDGESDDDGPDDSLESLVARTNVAEDDDAARRAANAEAAHRAALEQPEAVAT